MTCRTLALRLVIQAVAVAEQAHGPHRLKVLHPLGRVAPGAPRVDQARRVHGHGRHFVARPTIALRLMVRPVTITAVDHRRLVRACRMADRTAKNVVQPMNEWQRADARL